MIMLMQHQSSQKKPSEITKPDYVQDKFWDADKKEVNIENLYFLLITHLNLN